MTLARRQAWQATTRRCGRTCVQARSNGVVVRMQLLSRCAVLPVFVLVGILVASCASSPATSGAASDSTTSLGEPSGSETVSQIAIPPGPRLPCGVHNGLEASDLAQQGGESVALVQAKITQGPLPPKDGQEIVPLASVQLLAGESPEGPITGVQIPAVGGDAVPPGIYLLLLGDAGKNGTYFLSNGLRGSFVTSGRTSREQCPDYDHPGRTVLADSGVTSTDQLVALLGSALGPGNGKTPPEPSGSPSAPPSGSSRPS
jgi:hypothetical protein